MNFLNHSLCENINQFRLTMLMMGHATVDRSWTGKIQSPSYSRLYYIVSGSASILTDKGRYPLLPGRWYLLPAGCSFEYLCEKELEHIYFHIKLSATDGLDLLRCCNHPIYISAGIDDSFHLSSESNIMDGLIIHSKIYAVLLSILKEHGISINNQTFSRCVSKAIDYIRNHLSAQLTTEEIAANSFVSKSTLTKCFKKELNMTVQEYLYDVIMFEAVQQITHNSLSILELSERLGFSDQFYFSRCFKKKFGVPPREYKKTALV